MTPLPTYLSVDLDYWTARPEDFGGVDQADIAASDFLRRVRAWAPSVILCVDHDQIVPHVNGVYPHPIRRVINIDYHSDLPDWGADSRFPELNEGTWSLYVAMPHTKTFEWRSASKDRMPYRRCTSDPLDPDLDPFVAPGLTPYGSAIHLTGTRDIPWGVIAGAGICISPSWWGSDTRLVGEPIPMTRTRKLLGLRAWPGSSSRMLRVLKGDTVFDRTYQKRLATAFGARPRMI